MGEHLRPQVAGVELQGQARAAGSLAKSDDDVARAGCNINDL
jgi:hypothetical protein